MATAGMGGSSGGYAMMAHENSWQACPCTCAMTAYGASWKACPGAQVMTGHGASWQERAEGGHAMPAHEASCLACAGPDTSRPSSSVSGGGETTPRPGGQG